LHKGITILSARISYGKYKDIPIIFLENEKLIVKIIPQVGGKIQSIFHKEKNKEYLYQAVGNKYKKPKYEMLFEKSECSGFDDMFPTITSCYYPTEPWKGIRIPDHGEVWSLPWEYEINNNIINLTVYGLRFPYKFKKEIKLINTHEIYIKYKVYNNANYNFYFIWAAHPLFNCNQNTIIILPDSAKKIINVYDKSKRLGNYGNIFPWPIVNADLNHKYNMSRIRTKSVEACEKYYVFNEIKEGWSSLYDIETKEIITLSYPIEKVPYLGIWVNEGGLLGQYNVALEPCTGIFDRLDIAQQWNKIKVIKAKNKYEWFLKITIN
jgi:galactose mutarotase-like enzyme